MNVLRFFSPIKDLVVPDEERVYTVRLGPHRGLRWRCNLQEEAYRILGFHEYEVGPQVARYAKQSRVAADVGAADGWYTILLARHTDVTYAIDPHEERAQGILAQLDANDLAAALHTRPCGAKGLRLDDLDPFPDLVKVDVEGSEIDVIRSAGDRIDEATWIVETHGPDLLRQTRQLLDEAGLTVDTIEPNTTWLRDTVMEGRKWVIGRTPNPGPTQGP